MALGELTFTLLQDLAANKSSTEQGLDKLNVFGIVRMLETAIINLDRIHLIWDVVSAHLDCLANSRFADIRVLAVECFSCLAICILLSKDLRVDGKESVFWRDRVWERKMWSTVLNYLSSVHADTVHTAMATLPDILLVRRSNR